MRCSKIFLVILIGSALIVLMGYSSVLVAGQTDPPHQTHLAADRGPGLVTVCTPCHTASPGTDGNISSPLADACDTCHSPGGPYDGVNDSAVGALNNWDNLGDPGDAADSLIYQSDGKLKSGKEKWCASCHDTNGGIWVEDFEGYADTAALQAVWKHVDDAKPPVIEADSVPEGSKCLQAKIKWAKAAQKYGTLKVVFSPALDLSDADTVRFYVKLNTSALKKIKVRMMTSGVMSVGIVKGNQLAKKGWTEVSIARTEFTNNTDWSSVSKIQFRFIENGGSLEKVYLDNIRIFKAGATGPNIVGDNISRGYYVTGHKLSCTQCHDSMSAHLDDESLPELDYINETTNPTGFRLYSDVTKKLRLPYNFGNTSSYAAADFALCYRCHLEANLVGDEYYGNTNFVDYPPPECGLPPNLHSLHVKTFASDPWPSSCVHCHDPHGDLYPAMTRVEMGEAIYFDSDGCQIVDRQVDINSNDVADWYEPGFNEGLALQSGMGAIIPIGAECENCHLPAGVIPPDCGNNPYTDPQCLNDGFYLRDYVLRPHTGGGEPGPSCMEAGCHGNQSHLTHFDSDGKGPGISFDEAGCEVCHAGDSYYIDDMVAAGACDTCHSPDGAFDGVQMGAANWDSGVYEADGTTLKSSKAQWCATCHDDGVAFSHPVIVPDVIVDNEDAEFSIDAGTWNTYSADCVYVGTNFNYHTAGTEVYSVTWHVPAGMPAGTYRVYAIWCANSYRDDDVNYTINDSGGPHGVGPFDQSDPATNGIWVDLGQGTQTFTFAAGSGSVVLSGSNNDGIVHAEAIKFENVEYAGAYAPNVVGDNVDYGYYQSGHKLICTVCHDAGKDHIDHNPRTYEVVEPSVGDPDPEWVVVNAYEDGYRLGDVLGQRPMVIPKETTVDPLDPSEFALCFKCHDSEAILPYSPDGTNFYNNDANPQNSHWIHLKMSGARFCDSDWDTIIGGTNSASLDSIASCTTCHNVHGSQSATMTRFGELISTPEIDKTPALDFCYLDGVASRDCDLEAAYPSSVGGSMNCQGGYPEGGNAVCKHCHSGYIYYYRTAKDIAKPTNPVVSNRQVVPSNIANDGSGSLLFTAYVVDPNGDLNNVEIDLTALGGSSTQAMYDDGTNGDQAAGDEIYSYRLSGTTVAVGNKTLTITATDDLSNTGTEQVIVVVHNEYGAYIVDNEDSTLFSVTGAWNTWDTNCVHFGTNFHYHPSGPGDYSATWQVRSDMPAGTYRVYAIWCANAYRDDEVYYTITDNSGPHLVGPFDQTQDDGVWVDLGEGTQTFTFNAGSGSVVVSGTNNDGIVNAEAVKFEPVP